MFESIAVTALAVLFLALFGGGAVLRARNIDMDGKASIGRLFYSSSYVSSLCGQRWSGRHSLDLRSGRPEHWLRSPSVCGAPGSCSCS
jgi:hypothetical protein